jgi:RNA polymerase sigma factor (sigma-70 family)
MSFSGADLEALIPRLRRYASALARHPVRADDLVQDTLERAWSRRRQWQRGTDLRAWVFAILHNLFVSDMRRFAARGYDADPLDADAHADMSTERGGDAGVMLDIERALAALAPEQRAVVLLVGLEDLGYREAAEVLGVPIGTVMSRLSRGRARLRELMEGSSSPRLESPLPPRADPTSLQVVR